MSITKLAKPEPLTVSLEEMQRLYLDGRPIRRYCLQCRGPKFMFPSKKAATFHNDLVDVSTPDKYSIVCRNCGMKYTARIEKP